MKMVGMTCSPRQGREAAICTLHCPQSEKGGVQVIFETPDKDDLGGKKTFPFNQILCFWVLGEFLEDVVSSSGWEECVKMMVEFFQ